MKMLLRISFRHKNIKKNFLNAGGCTFCILYIYYMRASVIISAIYRAASEQEPVLHGTYVAVLLSVNLHRQIPPAKIKHLIKLKLNICGMRLMPDYPENYYSEFHSQ